MAQRIIEMLVGRLITDEQFRAEFLDNPEKTLFELCDRGLELSRTEIAALVNTDRRLRARAADAIETPAPKGQFEERNEDTMTRVVTYGCLACLLPITLAAQPAERAGERLSLDEAIRLAVANNRQVQSARLQIEKAEADVETARTRRLPIFRGLTTPARTWDPALAGFGTRDPAFSKVMIPNQGCRMEDAG